MGLDAELNLKVELADGCGWEVGDEADWSQGECQGLRSVSLKGWCCCFLLRWVDFRPSKYVMRNQ